MKQQVFNPYLPEWEYVPDGEPHVFGDRVYVYGSHDRFGAAMFCVDDYVCWSAPVDDLSDWRLEGTIFRKNQDPVNRLGLRLLFAPDVARGADGRFFQAEVTSCGLNGGSLAGKGVYQARIACNLWSARGAARVDGNGVRRRLAVHPYFTQEGRGREGRQYVANLRDGAVVGFKYFDLSATRGIALRLRGCGACRVAVAADENFSQALGVVELGALTHEWQTFSAPLSPASEKSALFLRFEGELTADFLELELVD